VRAWLIASPPARVDHVLLRYGDGEDEEEEEEVVDCSTGFEELVDESNELNAPQAFFEWFAAVGSKVQYQCVRCQGAPVA